MPEDTKKEIHTAIRLTRQEMESLEFIKQTLNLNYSDATRRSINYYAFYLANALEPVLEPVLEPAIDNLPDRTG
jgi:hypothetical protein